MKILNLSLMVENIPNGFQKAIRNVCSDYQELNVGILNFNERALDLAIKQKPDIIFIQIQRPNILNIEIAKKLSQIGFVINWTGDVRAVLPQWMIDVGKHIQLTCFSNMVDVYKAKEKGIKADYLDIGFDPERYNKHNIKFDCEPIVFFCNSYGKQYFPLSKYRLDIVERLKREFGNEIFGVYGNTPYAIKTFNSNQIRESQQYNNCKIAINCSHFDYERYSSDRILRIMGSGAFCLSHNFKGIELDYKIGEHLDVFNNIDDLVIKCKYYLENDSKRNEIANNGYKHIHQTKTFGHMAQNIIDLWRKNK